MHLQAEREMFLAAVKPWSHGLALHHLSWMEVFHSTEPSATIIRPAGSKFLHCAALAVAYAGTDAASLLLDLNSASLMQRGGRLFIYYEDGYDVLAGTGALAAFRRKQEDRLLCSG